MNAAPTNEVNPGKQDGLASIGHDPVKRRFRRIACLYLAASLIVGIICAAASWNDPPPLDLNLAIVIAVYWLLPLPILRVLFDWRRRGRQAVFKVVTSIVVVVILLEIVGLFVRLDPPAPGIHAGGLASRQQHHVMPSNSVQSMWDSAGGQVLVRTNEDGFRSEHSRREFLSFDRRVVVMGDSFVFGWLVAQEDTIPAQLESMLRDAFPGESVGVINAGVISYSPLIHRQVFKSKIAAYKPDLTIVCLDVTDIGDDIRYGSENVGSNDEPMFDFPEEWTRPKPPPQWESMTMQLLRKTRLTFPFEILGGDSDTSEDEELKYDYYAFDLEVGGQIEHNRFFVLRHPLSATRPFLENSYRHIRALSEMCRENGSAFLLVLLPRNFHWNADESPLNWEVKKEKHYRGDEPYRFTFFEFFEERAARDGLHLLSLLPAFKQSNIFPLCHRDDPHYNPTGCRLAAAAILDYLRKENLLDPKTPAIVAPTSAKAEQVRP